MQSDPSRPWIDHRTYTIVPRKMDTFLRLFDTLAMPVLLETLSHPLGFYVSQVGALNQFVHLWAYESLADYEARSQKRNGHPGFAEYLSRTEGLIQAQETRLFRLVPMPSLTA